MSVISYSFHLGSENNGIQSASGLAKVGKHNLRAYEKNNEEIIVVEGSNDLYRDVKELYEEEFEEARLEYNVKQQRDDRKIDNYFNYISNDKLRDLACEVITELGDKEFWQDKDENYKRQMTLVYNEQIKDLKKVVPEFKIATAVVHLDETSPHMHIVGVPISYDNKRGMKKQVAKSKVFTRESLTRIQDEMRKYCIKSFNRIYRDNLELKEKQVGRNLSIPVKYFFFYK